MPTAVGLTHASIVSPVVRSSGFASGTVTQSLTPSKLSAPPNRPAAVRVAPQIVPVLLPPEPSATVVPGRLVEPVGGDQAGRRHRRGLTVNVTAIDLGAPVAPSAPTVIVAVCVPAGSDPVAPPPTGSPARYRTRRDRQPRSVVGNR